MPASNEDGNADDDDKLGVYGNDNDNDNDNDSASPWQQR